jgi:hypothetical protein
MRSPSASSSSSSASSASSSSGPSPAPAAEVAVCFGARFAKTDTAGGASSASVPATASLPPPEPKDTVKDIVVCVGSRAAVAAILVAFEGRPPAPFAKSPPRPPRLPKPLMFPERTQKKTLSIGDGL